ncbi:MAG: hypothetical protein ACO3A4_14865 [Silvanigrellaceae bacterium]
MIRKTVSTFAFSAAVLAVVSACGTSSKDSSTASVQQDLEMARALTISCKGKSTPENQLALELSKQCRAQNVELKAKGLPACSQDECSDLVTLEPAKKGLTGSSYIYDSQGNPVGFQVVVSNEIALSTKEKLGLICYAPSLKAQELLGTSAFRCK